MIAKALPQMATPLSLSLATAGDYGLRASCLLAGLVLSGSPSKPSLIKFPTLAPIINFNYKFVFPGFYGLSLELDLYICIFGLSLELDVWIFWIDSLYISIFESYICIFDSLGIEIFVRIACFIFVYLTV